MAKEHHVDPSPAARPAGRARVGRAVGRAPTPDRARTEMLRIGPERGAPVFVDPSGNRRRRLRPVMYVLALLIALILLAVWASQLGGTAPPPDVRCATETTGTTAGTAAPDPADCKR